MKCLLHNSAKFRQFLVTVVVNLVSLAGGITCGWASPVIPQLLSNNPPVGDSPMTVDQISWISSLLPIGGILITPFSGILMERIGRKKFALLTAVPQIVSWLLIIFAQNHVYLYVARLTGGMSAAMSVFIVPLYVSEIATEDIRGTLCSLLVLAINIGVLFAFVAGAYLSYQLFACLSLLFSLAFIVLFGFMPETPINLVRQNRPKEAHKSLMFLRGNNKALVDQELVKLQSDLQISNNSSSTIKLRDFLNDRATRKGLIISFILLGGQQFSGIFAMISYAETIFQRAGSSLSSEIAPIIIGTIQIVGSYMSTMLMERAGRRLLTLISCLGMAISHVIVGIFFCLQQNNHDVSSISWLPIVALSAYILTYCLGMAPVPFVVTSEIFRLEVISIATSVCYVFYWSMSFASIQVFTAGTQGFGVGGCFFMLAIFCAVCFVFCYFLLPETKGRQRQDIVDELAGIVDKRGNSDELKA